MATVQTDRFSSSPALSLTDRFEGIGGQGLWYFAGNHFAARYFAAQYLHAAGGGVGGTSTDRFSGDPGSVQDDRFGALRIVVSGAFRRAVDGGKRRVA